MIVNNNISNDLPAVVVIIVCGSLFLYSARVLIPSSALLLRLVPGRNSLVTLVTRSQRITLQWPMIRRDCVEFSAIRACACNVRSRVVRIVFLSAKYPDDVLFTGWTNSFRVAGPIVSLSIISVADSIVYTSYTGGTKRVYELLHIIFSVEQQ